MVALASAPELPLVFKDPHETRWFSRLGCVVSTTERVEVRVAGTIVASFSPDDRAARNVALVGLAADPRAHLGQIADAFGISEETLRVLRRQHESEGLARIIETRKGGKTPLLRGRLKTKAEKMFAEGKTIVEVHRAVGGASKLSVQTVWRARKAWRAEQATSGAAPSAGADVQLALPSAARDETAGAGGDVPPPENTPAHDDGSHDESADHVAPAGPVSAPHVQHLGSWLLLAVVASLGLHARAGSIARAVRPRGDATSLRVALDAVIVALAIGERCVEGVRRLATSSASALLLARAAPTPSWVRRVVGAFAENGSPGLHLGMTGAYLRAAREDSGVAGPVFYVDNHMRPYTGERTLREGWRMQDKRARPGCSDYWVHDEDGRPVMRMTAPHHGSLTEFLRPVAKLLRTALPDETILLAFDRAGAYADELAALRDAGFEFVTYERKPYQTLPASAFTQTIEIDGERLGIADTRKNLRKSRGRVRRIAVRTEDGRQVNLVAVSKRSAEELVTIMRGRWRQENAFKHGAERWGINQLDGRRTVAYPPDTMIPNPARRRLDRALRLLRTSEGELRIRIAEAPDDEAHRAPLEQELARLRTEREALEAQRPDVPKHARIEDTELAGKLVHHTQDYKRVLDTVRIACANAESDLAAVLGPQLKRPAEAKRVLASLFLAPGRVRVSRSAVRVRLETFGTRSEREAIATLLREVTRWELTLPGDPKKRPLHFSISQKS